MSCNCDCCMRDEDEVEIHHTCEECLNDGEKADLIHKVSAQALNEIVFGSETDDSMVEHLVTCHADTLPDAYRDVCRKMEKVKALLERYQDHLAQRFLG